VRWRRRKRKEPLQQGLKKTQLKGRNKVESEVHNVYQADAGIKVGKLITKTKRKKGWKERRGTG